MTGSTYSTTGNRTHKTPKNRAFWWLVGTVVCAVVVPRIVAGVVSGPYLFTRGDLNWDAMARNLLAGKGLLIPHVGPMRMPMLAHKTPVFALVLAGVYATVGRHAAAIVAVQILFSLLCALGIYLLGSRLTGSRPVGWLAAIAASLYPPLVVQDVQLMETALYTALVAFLTYAAYESAVRPKTITLLVTGLLAGLTVLTRATIMPFLLVLAVWFIAIWGRQALSLLPDVVLAVVVFLAALSPWLVRNYVLFQQVHLVTGGGRSFWIGSSEPFLRMFPRQSVDRVEDKLWNDLPREDRVALRKLNEIQLDQALKNRAFESLAKHPDRMGKLAVLKLEAAFSPVLNPRVDRDRMDARFESMKRLVYTLSYTPLLLLAAAGLVLLTISRPRAGTLLWAHVLAFAAVAVVFWAHSRHRYYLDALMTVPAAWFLVKVWHSTRRHGRAG